MNRKKKKFNRLNIFIIIMSAIFVIISVKLAYIQIVRGEEYDDLANTNSFTQIEEQAPRGNIYDRNGEVLATNTISYSLIFTQTTESNENFFETMDKVFSILDEYNAVQLDEFDLKIDPFRFEFNTDNPETKIWAEKRFKKDRGLDEKIVDGEKVELDDEELLSILPEDTFNYLLLKYEIDDPENPKYTIEQEKRYMLVKDSLYIQSFSGNGMVTIAQNLSEETAFVFLQRLNEMPGIDVITEPIRYYPEGELAASILGYTAKIQPWQQDEYEEKGYNVNTDYIGTQGIEQVYEARLKGSKGANIVRINQQGRVIEQLGEREPYPGQDIYLTIDKRIQKAAEESLKDVMIELQKRSDSKNATRGAAVAIDIKTGEILALASEPSYDPNLFTTSAGLTEEQYNKYFNPDYESFAKDYIERSNLSVTVDDLFPEVKDEDGNVFGREDFYDIFPKPFFNYAISALVPPGSTFKPLTSIAALEEGVIDTTTTIQDKGIFTKYGYNGKCWIYSDYGMTHGFVNVVKALEVSCNYFFYTIGDYLQMYGSKGEDTLAKYAWQFGLGSAPGEKPTTGIELYDSESFGQVYNYESSKNVFSATFLKQLNLLLENGTDRQGNKYKSINLLSNENDSSELKNMKEKLQNYILDQMKNTDVSTSKSNEFFAEMQSQITSIIDKDSSLKKIGYSESDILTIANAINYSVNDCHGEIDTPTNILNASIGQGLSRFTPIQLASYIATVANGGTRYSSHLVKTIKEPSENQIIEETKPEVMNEIEMKDATLKAVFEGMLKVTSGEDGTATVAFSGFPIQTAGKTGTATFSTIEQEVGRDAYGVYVGFAPYDNPEIAVCTVIFDGAHGGSTASVARAIYEEYFKEDLKEKYPTYVAKYDYTAEDILSDTNSDSNNVD
ncbi:MAG: penicillin-binding transpeptidase domain-containing protein [Clostridiaceae bacterium]